jgi:hypothetical protein
MLKLDTTEEFAGLVASVSRAQAEASAAEFEARSERSRLTESAVADCMKRQGFDYTPQPYRPATGGVTVDWWQNIDAIVVPTLPAGREDVARFGSRMVKLNAEWAQCMADRGIGHLEVSEEDQVTPYSALAVALRTSPDGVYWEPDGQAGAEEPPEHRSLAMSQPEIRIALAGFDCRADLGYEATANRIALELQKSFVNEHGGEVSRLLAALEVLSAL